MADAVHPSGSTASSACTPKVQSACPTPNVSTVPHGLQLKPKRNINMSVSYTAENVENEEERSGVTRRRPIHAEAGKN